MATSIDSKANEKRDDNLDPITGEPGAHPVGAGIGAAGGAAAGAAVGAAAGPVGIAVGAIVGGVVGGLTGKGLAEGLDPTAEDAYWRAEHAKQGYGQGTSYDDYAPAYRVGYTRHKTGTRFEDAESDLRKDYDASRGESRVEWDMARPAAEQAWRRAERLRADEKA